MLVRNCRLKVSFNLFPLCVFLSFFYVLRAVVRD